MPGPGTGARPPLADLLAHATAEDHRAAENQAFQQALVGGEVRGSTLAAYQSGVLELVRAVHSRLPTAGDGWGVLRSAMAGHASRLQRDLEGLRNGASATPPSPAVSAFVERLGGAAWPPGAALGVFYVIEGSMNGNRFIRRALAGNRPELAGNLRYFDPYGAAQRERWQEFRQEISRIGETIGVPEPAVRAARATFRVFSALAAEVRPGRAA